MSGNHHCADYNQIEHKTDCLRNCVAQRVLDCSDIGHHRL